MNHLPDFEARWAHFLTQFAAQVPNFQLDTHNEPIYRRLLAYFTGDEKLLPGQRLARRPPRYGRLARRRPQLASQRRPV